MKFPTLYSLSTILLGACTWRLTSNNNLSPKTKGTYLTITIFQRRAPLLAITPRSKTSSQIAFLFLVNQRTLFRLADSRRHCHEVPLGVSPISLDLFRFVVSARQNSL